ncbi:hypothetical protein CC80DRAFT_508463 [Byssothecium circinans]|uniref:CCHC-type domain-containing protein n=1 Tax=Byssothecium circinans TaxID=147558 RepID=A0A6A5TLW9_9PLEO|nr:hypothetical protein CC80DRAFT_508463 [Byssothecium circinans]
MSYNNGHGGHGGHGHNGHNNGRGGRGRGRGNARVFPGTGFGGAANSGGYHGGFHGAANSGGHQGGYSGAANSGGYYQGAANSGGHQGQHAGSTGQANAAPAVIHTAVRSRTPEAERSGAPHMPKPRPTTTPESFYPPAGEYVDQTNLPEGFGNRVGDTVCTHCHQPYGEHHRDSRLCRRECGVCHKKDHQGKPCPSLFVSWNFWAKNVGRTPRADEGITQIRPSDHEAAELSRAGWTDFASLKPASRNVPTKRRAEDELEAAFDRNFKSARYNNSLENAEARCAAYKQTSLEFKEEAIAARKKIEELEGRLREQERIIADLQDQRLRAIASASASASVAARLKAERRPMGIEAGEADDETDEVVAVLKEENE